MNRRTAQLISTLTACLSLCACVAKAPGSNNQSTGNTSAVTYTIGGSVSGYTGLGLVLEDNGKDDLPIGTNGIFNFVTPVATGSAYKVIVLTQPSNSTQNCTVSNGSGTATANVTNVQITCAIPTYSIGGTITGLTASGLVLQDNNGDNLPIAANQTNFTFATLIANGSPYSVSVSTQPPNQNCTVTSGTGVASANVTNIQIACATLSSYTIGGTITGLSGTGLVLQDNSGDNLSIAAGKTSFTFATLVPTGGSYAVTVLTQPSNPTQTCTLTNASGTATSNVTNIQLVCTTPSSFTIGGTIVGLTRSGLVLQDNGTDNLTILDTQTTFTFATSVHPGGTYAVTVLTQPVAENCTVTNGSGTANANVTNVAVTCTGQWTWIDGSNILDQPGVYGNQGMAAAGNVPGARYGSSSWTDSSGNFWLFGGYGYDAAGSVSYLNDLWEYSSGQWTWVSGSNSANSSGIYGTQGVATAANIPGSRYYAASWTDGSGNLWLFGGDGYDSAGNFLLLNDLWKYSPSAGQWTWESGSNVGNKMGVYGSQGTATPSNVPGSRAFAVGWFDKSANLWLFGGSGYDSTDTLGQLNDLWEYATTTGEWTWVSGSNLVGQSGVYGTLGTGAPGDTPGARINSAHWTDPSGNLWLFGGQGPDSVGLRGLLNDIWEYSGGQWTWIGGPNTAGALGSYGTQGVAAPSNLPGSRQHAFGSIDASGDVWLFGGYGWPSNGQQRTPGDLNDLWKYSAGEWTWISGSTMAGQPGTYGTLGVPAPANVPGARDSSVGWIDASGNLWLFGGAGASTSDAFNDLWKFEP